MSLRGAGGFEDLEVEHQHAADDEGVVHGQHPARAGRQLEGEQLLSQQGMDVAAQHFQVVDGQGDDEQGDGAQHGRLSFFSSG